MKPSKYQKAIYNWIKKGKGNIVIQAVAGSGKTTTIINATKLLDGDEDSLFVAFNKAIADELRERLPEHIKSSTLHSLGLGMFYANTNINPKVEFDKLSTIIKAVLQDNSIKEESRQYSDYFSFLRRIIPLIKATLIDYNKFEELDEIMAKFNVEFDVDGFTIVLIREILEKCKKQVEVIDFDDMIWIPIVNNFHSKTYDWVFIDELQDLNKAQFELVKKVCNGHTRVVGVGDRQQSIYAFRAADTMSMDNFKEYFKAKEMPLSICYRCDRKIVEMAQQIVPEIECKENVEDGIVENIDVNTTIEKANDGNLILCRTNAPLVGMAFSLIRQHKKAIIRGRDIGKGLIRMVDKYQYVNLNDLIGKINGYKELQEEKIMLIDIGKYDKKKKTTLMTQIDSCETIITIAENVETVEELKATIEKIFSDENEGIVCSSIHKAKGLEADKVFILRYDLMPHPMAKTDEEIEQEQNIKYVAITRAKKELYLINEGR